MKKEIYLDSAASTPVLREVVKEMQKYLSLEFGNPGSLHRMGETAKKAVDKARKSIAKEINANVEEIYFTSGATESNNLVLKGVVFGSKKRKIIISSLEHPSVRESALALKNSGFKIVEVPVSENGKLDLQKLEKEIDKNTLLVSVIHVNNILGFVQHLEKIGKICREKKVLFHTDAVQSFGKLSIDVKKANVDLLSASGHKIGGPKGIGFLYIRKDVEISPLFHGGGQEKGIRSGTLNVSGIVGFEKALEIYKRINKKNIEISKNKLENGLKEIGGKINSRDDGIYNIIHVSFPEIEGEALVYYLSRNGIYVSSGSACDSKKSKDDLVLMAAGLSKPEIKGSVRISLGKPLTDKEIDFVVSGIEKSVKNLKIKF